jgi:hypothetical protein
MDKKLKILTNKIIEEQSKQISSEVSSRLNQARQKALNPEKNKFNLFTSWYIPATAIAALFVYFSMPLLQDKTGQISISNVSIAAIEDMQVIEDYELIENLEFYQWLSTEDEMPSI